MTHSQDQYNLSKAVLPQPANNLVYVLIDQALGLFRTRNVHLHVNLATANAAIIPCQAQHLKCMSGKQAEAVLHSISPATYAA